MSEIQTPPPFVPAPGQTGSVRFEAPPPRTGTTPQQPPVTPPQPSVIGTPPPYFNPSVPTLTAPMRTFEIFGVWQRRNVPLMHVLERTYRGWSVVRGARVLIADHPSEGFGLAGMPGRWSEFYGGRSPAEFGQDPTQGILFLDANTQRGFAVPAQQLAEFFGNGWRTVIYGEQQITAQPLILTR